MATHGNSYTRLGGLSAALLMLLVSEAGCTTDDAVTAPAVTAAVAAAKPIAQPPTSATFELQNGLGVGSDLSSDGVTGVYQDQVCGVTARVFYSGQTYVDGNMQLANSMAGDKTCTRLPGGTYPRTLTVRYPDTNNTDLSTGGINVVAMGSVLMGAPALRSMGVRLAGTGARCSSLDFGRITTASKVLVTRLSPTSWSIASQATNTVACVPAQGATTFIPNFTVAFTVTLN